MRYIFVRVVWVLVVSVDVRVSPYIRRVGIFVVCASLMYNLLGVGDAVAEGLGCVVALFALVPTPAQAARLISSTSVNAITSHWRASAFCPTFFCSNSYSSKSFLRVPTYSMVLLM